jgi:WD40 repeat protein
MNAFAVSPAKGRKLLADFCRNTLAKGRSNPGWYVRRHAVEHFLEVEDWDSATGALSDLDFIRARAVAQELGMMLLDYVAAIKCLPEGEIERRTEAARQAELDRYAQDMVQYAAAWSRIRDGSREERPKLPRPVEQVRMWTSEEIAAERKRITEMPNRLDVVKAFRVFIASNSAPLHEWSAREGFVAQLARNDAPAGPVHEAGKRALERLGGIKLCKQFLSGEIYNSSQACLKVLEGHTRAVGSVVLSADGRRAISGSMDGTLRVWDVESGECLKVLEGHTDCVDSVVLSADGRRAISGSMDTTLRVWDVESGKCLKVLEGHTSKVSSVVLSADGRRAISGSYDTTLRVWDVERGVCLKVLEGHTGGVVLSADGRRAISGGNEGRVDLSLKSLVVPLRVWDVESGECVKVLERHNSGIGAVVMSADGCRVISGSEDGMLLVWNVDSGECLKVFQAYPSAVRLLALNADGRRVISGNENGALLVWDVESGRCLNFLDGHTQNVVSVVLSADGRRVISGSMDSTLRVWDVESGECLKVLEGHTESARSVVLSADGRLVISGSYDNTLRVWDVESGECLRVRDGHTFTLCSVVLSADGRRAISGSRDSTLRVWNVETGECLRVLEGHASWVHSVILSADGRRVISGSRDNTLRVWDVESGECLKVLEGHTQYISSVVLSADGRLVISGSDDNTLRVWDVKSGECLAVVFLRGFKSVNVSWSSGALIAGWSDDTVRGFLFENLSLGSFITTAQREIRSEDLPAGPVTARPACCGQRISIPEPIAERIEYFFLNSSETAYTDPALLLNCPSCGTPLRMNPFFIDIPAND